MTFWLGFVVLAYALLAGCIVRCVSELIGLLSGDIDESE